MNDSALSAQCGSYGSADCPCVLSVLKECLVCSHLQGKEFCDCQWNKYCVFINFLHDQKDFLAVHQDFLAPVRRLNMGGCGCRVFLTAPRAVFSEAGNLRLVLLKSRPPLDLEIPAVVLSTYPDHGLISMAANLPAGGAGSFPESSRFDLVLGEKPAITGLDQLKGVSGKRVLVVAEDFGQLMVESLVKNHLSPGNQVTVILSHSLPAINRKLEEMAVNYRVAGPISSEGLAGEMPGERLYHLCFSLGSPRLHREVKAALSVLGNGIPHYPSSIEEITGP